MVRKQFRGITIDLIGTKELRKNLRKARGRMEKAIAAGLYGVGNNVMTLSKSRVPVDLGTLKNSGYVTLPKITSSRVVVELGFGGAAAAYAEVQHEHTEYNHPEGGEAKYLESAVNNHARTFSRDVAKLAKAAFERNYGPKRSMSMPTAPTDEKVE